MGVRYLSVLLSAAPKTGRCLLLIGLTFDLIDDYAVWHLAYIIFATDTPAMIAAKPVLIFFIVLLGFNSAISMHLNLKANQLLPVAVFGMLSYLEPVLLFYCVDCMAGRAGAKRRI